MGVAFPDRTEKRPRLGIGEPRLGPCGEGNDFEERLSARRRSRKWMKTHIARRSAAPAAPPRSACNGLVYPLPVGEICAGRLEMMTAPPALSCSMLETRGTDEFVRPTSASLLASSRASSPASITALAAASAATEASYTVRPSASAERPASAAASVASGPNPALLASASARLSRGAPRHRGHAVAFTS